MAYFYENINENIFNLLTNQYLYIKDTDGILVDALCWNGKTHRKLKYNTFNSTMFGAIKPKKNDIYQASAFDSLNNNIITMLKGKAGSGKSILATSFLMHKLEKDEIDKIIIFCNTVATKNSARLGFYPGSRDEKLLDSQIGNFLGSKFGSKMIVEKMIADEKLLLLPMSDIRGFDTNGMRAGIYITEA